MRTKKFFLVALLVTIGLVSVNSAKAQGNPTDHVALKLILNPVQSITVNPAQKDVTLEYKGLDDYATTTGNNSKFLANHLTVFSTSKFSVEATAPAFADVENAASKPPISSITLQAKGQNAISLGETSTTPLYSSENGSTTTEGTKIDVTYSGATVNSYLNSDYFKKTSEGASEVTTFTTTVTYTLIAG
jgi:hypothetical protein